METTVSIKGWSGWEDVHVKTAAARSSAATSEDTELELDIKMDGVCVWNDEGQVEVKSSHHTSWFHMLMGWEKSGKMF